MILVIANPRQTESIHGYHQQMKRPRIAIIGDTEFRSEEWTDAMAIAIEIASRWDTEVGLRTVAANAETERLLRQRLESAGVSSWLTVRNDTEDLSASRIHADVRMGDALQIPQMFDHDVIIIESRDARLRRFLADLPVHTRPDVRIIACIHFERGPVLGERLEDLLRFDALIGGEDDFLILSKSLDADASLAVLGPVQRRMVGSNLRAAIAWNERGSFSLAEPHGPILSIASEATPNEADSTSWPAFVGAVAVGIARRDPWIEIGRGASQAYARRSYT